MMADSYDTTPTQHQSNSDLNPCTFTWVLTDLECPCPLIQPPPSHSLHWQTHIHSHSGVRRIVFTWMGFKCWWPSFLCEAANATLQNIRKWQKTGIFFSITFHSVSIIPNHFVLTNCYRYGKNFKLQMEKSARRMREWNRLKIKLDIPVHRFFMLRCLWQK